MKLLPSKVLSNEETHPSRSALGKWADMISEEAPDRTNGERVFADNLKLPSRPIEVVSCDYSV